jgi:uncharacterized integral membrane protein (TIGR00697 family)
MKKNIYSGLYVLLSVIYVTALNTANIVAVKQVQIGTLMLTAGQLVFPVIYILSDIFSEAYGYKASRQVAWIAFGMNIFMVLVFNLTIALPYPVWWTNNSAFALILGSVPRIVTASLVAFQAGDWLNDIVFQKMKGKHGERLFWLRAIVSSILGEAVDSGLFFAIALIGAMPISALPIFIVSGVAVKCCYELIILPFTSLIVTIVKKHEENSFALHEGKA